MAPVRKASSHPRPDGVRENFRISSHPERNLSPEKGCDAPGLVPPSPPPRLPQGPAVDTAVEHVSLSLQSSGKSPKLDGVRPLRLLQPRQLFPPGARKSTPRTRACQPCLPLLKDRLLWIWESSLGAGRDLYQEEEREIHYMTLLQAHSPGGSSRAGPTS